MVVHDWSGLTMLLEFSLLGFDEYLTDFDFGLVVHFGLGFSVPNPVAGLYMLDLCFASWPCSELGPSVLFVYQLTTTFSLGLLCLGRGQEELCKLSYRRSDQLSLYPITESVLIHSNGFPGFWARFPPGSTWGHRKRCRISCKAGSPNDESQVYLLGTRDEMLLCKSVLRPHHNWFCFHLLFGLRTINYQFLNILTGMELLLGFYTSSVIKRLCKSMHL